MKQNVKHERKKKNQYGIWNFETMKKHLDARNAESARVLVKTRKGDK